MTEYSTIDVSIDGPVGILTMNRPKAMNSIDSTMRGELIRGLTSLAGDDDIRVVVLTGTERSFCAGADLQDPFPPNVRVEDILNSEYRPSLELIRNMEKPVIAAVSGPAAGIGLSYMQICDLSVMADNAYLLSPFQAISLIPDGGATWLLVRQLGYQRAYRLCVEGERLPASECLELGLTNKVVPAADLLNDALEWARDLARRAPLSLAYTKRAMRAAQSFNYRDAFSYEAQLQNTCLGSEDCQEGIQAFVEKRKATFKGR